MARASTVAVVVPSPATSFVLVATSLASWAPMFSNGSSSSISLAIVTPSLVMVGAPHFLSSTTLRPFGPSVIDTVSASLLTPASRALRASSSNFSSLAAIQSSLMPWAGGEPRPTAESRRRLLLDDGEDVAGRQDQVLVALDLDLGAAVLRVNDLVPDLDVHRDALPIFETAGTHGDDLALLRPLLRCVRDDQARRRGLLNLAGLDHHAGLQRFQAELLGHSRLLGLDFLGWGGLALSLPEC